MSWLVRCFRGLFTKKLVGGESMPIQDDGNIDVIAKRRSGGVDLFIGASAFLDGSSETQTLLKNKLQTYLDAICTEEFQVESFQPLLLSALLS